MSEFKLPAIGEGVVEGEIVRWLKQPGDHVAANEAIVEVMTDKATVEIPSPRDAVVESIVVAEGAIAAVGETIAMFGNSVAASAPAPAAVTAPAPAPLTAAPAPMAGPSNGESAAKVLATPAARAHARERGIDLAHVPGERGRVTKADVVRAQAAPPPRATTPASPGPTVAVATTPTATQPAVAAAAPVVRRDLGAPAADESIPFRGMRRIIADGMKKSYFTAVHYTYVEQVNVTKLVDVRKQAKAAAAEQGVSLSYLPFIVKAVVLALKRFPIVNAELDEAGGQIILRKRYNIGIAAATPNGLMVPVLHDADRLSLLDVAREIDRLSEAARTMKTTRAELTGSTFTITSLGAIGGVLATPILNHPEVGILGVHAIRKTPVVDESDNIVVGHLMNLSVSLDHRVVDGFEGASFLQEVRRYLEDPTLLLLAGI
jgi:pyruvate dehydrogenase E2 component (dihydrolipoamide acetyltransferase)